MRGRATTTLRFLGLAEPPVRQRQRVTSHVRIRGAATREPDGGRRVVVDADVLLAPRPAPTVASAGRAVDLTEPQTRSPAAHRPAAQRRTRSRATGRREVPRQRPGVRRAPRRRVAPLVALGLARPRVVVSGHPRIRARVLEQIRRRQAREQLVTASIGALLLIVLATWGLLRSPLMAVEAVSVVGIGVEEVAVVEQAAAVAPGTNVLDVDLDRVDAAVSGLAWVEAVTVRRRLPATIEIRVAERRPLLAAVYGDATYLLDREGVVLSRAESTTTLPTMELALPPAVGSTLDTPDIEDVTTVAAAMPAGLDQWIDGYEAVAEGMVDAALTVPTSTGPLALVAHLGRPVDIAAKAATVASLVTEVVESGQRPRAVDVRIPDRPVVIP